MLTGSAGCRVPRIPQSRSSRSGCRKDTCAPHTSDTHTRPARHTVHAHAKASPPHHHTDAIVTSTAQQRVLTGSAGCRVPRRLQPQRSRSGCTKDSCAPHTSDTHTKGARDFITHTLEHHAIQAQRTVATHPHSRILTVAAGCQFLRRLQPPRPRSGSRKHTTRPRPKIHCGCTIQALHKAHSHSSLSSRRWSCPRHCQSTVAPPRSKEESLKFM